ncbi:MAG: radical SAM protein [Spirochaetes bacterium]|nr:radical SAM protein [Spirochaetota bacterium]
MIELVEKYITIGGEASLLGIPIYLFRFKGCNLDCSYCDTPYKNEVNDYFTVRELADDILHKVKQYPELKILFTGGEPLLGNRQNELLSIISDLENIDFYIETNGSISIENIELTNCFYIVDWKSPSSGFPDSFCADNLKKMRIENDCIKFIINKDDFAWVKEVVKIIQKVNPFIPLYITPQWGKMELVELSDFILTNRLPLKLSIQLHKYIWKDSKRGH